MKLKLKESPGEWTRFALVLLVLFSGLASFALWRGFLPFAVWAAIVGLLLTGFVLLLFQPDWRRAVYRGGMSVSFRIGQTMGRVLLCVFYVVMLIPLALLLRLLGKDPLEIRSRPPAETYWKKSRPSTALDRLF